MAQNPNDQLGFPKKYVQSYFRSWQASDAAGGFINGYARPGFYELSGNAFSIQCDNVSNGTKIAINEAGLYYTALTMRISSGSTSVAVVSNKSWQENNNGNGTTREIVTMSVTASGIRVAGSGIAYLVPGDYIYVTASSTFNTTETTWQIAKIGPAL
jgi:hypothetical protein